MQMAPRKKPLSLLQHSINVFARCLLQYQMLFIAHHLWIPASVAVCPEVITTALSTHGPVSLSDYLVVLGLFLPMTVRVLDFKGKVDCYAVPLATLKRFANAEVLSICSTIVPDEGLANLLPAFSHLKTLILDGGISDSELGEIGATCTELEHLAVNAVNLTDDGISAFCALIGVKNQLKKIFINTEDIDDIEDAEITVKSAVSILNTCPNLQEFDFWFCKESSLYQLVDIMTGHGHNPLQITQFRKIEIRLIDLHYKTSSNDLIKFALVFPAVRRLCFEQDDLLLASHLNRFSNLNELYLENVSASTCQLILEQVGAQLTSLDVRCSSLDILLVGQKCPRLEHLCLNNVVEVSDLSLAERTAATDFASLTCLEIDLFIEQSDSIKQYCNTISSLEYLLLQAKNVLNLSLWSHHSLPADYLSREEFKSNRMKIESLCLTNCHSVWPKDIEILLKSSKSHLRCLTINQCAKISQSYYEFLKNIISVDNLDVKLNFTENLF